LRFRLRSAPSNFRAPWWICNVSSEKIEQEIRVLMRSKVAVSLVSHSEVDLLQRFATRSESATCRVATWRTRSTGRQAHRWRDGGQGKKLQRTFLHPNGLHCSDLSAKAPFSWRDGGQGAMGPRYWRAGLAWPHGSGIRSQGSGLRRAEVGPPGPFVASTK